MKNTQEEQLYQTISQWLQEYHTTKEICKKNRLKALIATQMLPIIQRIAHTIARRSYDPIDDLVQAGSLGLLKAIDSYSESTNDNFKIYAGYLIIGEMKHYLRDKLNMIRVPRYIQELSYRINTFTSNLTLEELNNLTNEDVAEALNISKKEIDYAIQADRRKSTISLEDIYASDTDNLSFEEVLSKGDYKENSDIEDTRLVLKELIERLPDEYQTIINLYYQKDLNQKEISDTTQLSPMQVSRKLKKALSMLHQIIMDEAIEV